MAVLDGQPAASDPDDLVGTALGKVLRALPEGVAKAATSVREHTAAAPRRSARPDAAVTASLVAAVAARHRVRVSYRTESGSEWEAEVDPWAVVARHGHWYLLCHSHRAAAVRTYRVDRVRRVVPLEREFTPPADLDPVAALEEHLGTGWGLETRVVFEAPREQVAPWVGAPMGTLTDIEEGCLLVGSTRNPAMYAQEWLARVPFPFRVEGGPELRAAVATVAERFRSAVTD